MIICFIPAKEDSKRLTKKNVILAAENPLIHYTVKSAKECKSIDKVYISTDSKEIAEYSRKQGVEVITRPGDLCGETPLSEVYYHALMAIDNPEITHVVGLQPDHPDRTLDISDAIEHAIDKDLDELISVDRKGIRNGSIRIIKADVLRSKKASVKLGTIMDDCINIHTKRDLLRAEARMKLSEKPTEIQNKTISKKGPVFVIAEAACNHMCDIELTKKMIDEAKKAGADAIKFQTYKAEKLVIKEAKSYWKYPGTKSQFEYYKNLDKFCKEDYKLLFDYANKKGIIAFSTPFDVDSAQMLNELNMPLFKIASCDIQDKRLLRTVAGFGKPVIVSLGGAEIEEIEEIIDVIYGENNFSLILLVCTFSYPTQDQDAHLSRLRTIQNIFPDIIIGLSDHTEPEENMVIPSLGVALGAKVIEKHFTLDRTMTGSGHSFSVDPPLLQKMIQNIRLSELVLGNPGWEKIEAEENTKKSARRSLVADTYIKKGDVIKEKMIGVKRPSGGVSQKYIDEIIGKKAKRDIKIDEQIAWEDQESL